MDKKSRKLLKFTFLAAILAAILFFDTFPYSNSVQLLVCCRVDPTSNKTTKKQNVAIILGFGVMWYYIDLSIMSMCCLRGSIRVSLWRCGIGVV